MSNSSWVNDPNETLFSASQRDKYVASRLVVHGGVTVAIALRQEVGSQRLAYDYAVLDPSGVDSSSKGKDDQPQGNDGQAYAEMLDANGWSDSPLPLPFSNEIRVVGEDAVPNFRLSPVDRSGQKVPPESQTPLDDWRSTTLCLTHGVNHFEVLSDGKPTKSALLTGTCSYFVH